MNATLFILCKSYRIRIKRESHGKPLPICGGHTNWEGTIKNRCKKCNLKHSKDTEWWIEL